ncbi:MAG: hypothetical protein JNL74_14390, partial [Fibrobacteres bacterium]|nr:hypothetical protein [Fibrobacterota bacterium]
MEIISNPFSDLGNLLAKKLNSLANIHESFLIPPEFKLAELLPNQESPSFQNRRHLFTFPGEAYEFHADTPTFLVKIFSFDTAKHLALVTPVKYYHNIIKTREQVPVFCVNSSDILVAYNRPFNNLIVDSTQEQPLLGATIGRLFEPTPEKNARAILESLILPHFKRVNINDTKTVSDRTTHISVNHVFDWNLDDIKLDIEMDNIDNLPPCIIFGDSFVESIPFTD